MQSISFDEGYKEFAINNDENRVIRFNPKDFGILTRMEDTLSDFEALEKKLKDGNEEEFTNNLREAEKVVHEKIDSIFNANVHDIIFNHQSPISLVGGEFLFMRVIEALVPIVEKEVKYEMQKSEKRMSKYTEKYKK
ncbi:hypothetical protein [Eubacterium ventriosum]|jgi:hypothetical protein|uniref:hypothetical protein n=1 Tax=Eubacterium ventriosum TaxID=39496 RepID=UPI002056A97D|nr:hypothetical protein [Eubacterium ventriosum]DAP77789.1 MAG TPA: hypothetical protein [Caudoviricetes sp.]